MGSVEEMLSPCKHSYLVILEGPMLTLEAAGQLFWRPAAQYRFVQELQPRVELTNQLHLLGSAHKLNVLFAGNGVVNVFVGLVIKKIVHVVAAGKGVVLSTAAVMLNGALLQVVGYTGVQNGSFRVGQDVDIIAAAM